MEAGLLNTLLYQTTLVDFQVARLYEVSKLDNVAQNLGILGSLGLVSFADFDGARQVWVLLHVAVARAVFAEEYRGEVFGDAVFNAF